ncbi:hypothetical protein [Segniliparus rugosus]|uniref:WXG100 family type VII secretion target n=1 Tax=Segniliparus rugosus (strain ATCC BAA-974 / DSM 45345 / CCUG 50838 / CIP 108380 / JCM 13579 / CDC 945) TaxID=679197 RepID=E5XLP8_SEGRC|nr:hypothetical protein [Segniliparus rugosus]EFV14726.1 hypothetical protein HMPREF9336_00417 [Segniliparus rugosus ATCC BAA-974]
MSDGKLHMKAERVREAARAVGALADKMDADKQKLDGELAATDGSWGNDDAGRDFAKGHVPATQTSGESGKGLIGAVRSLSVALGEAADGVEGKDEGNAHNLDTRA